jgi:hypothetical protein
VRFRCPLVAKRERPGPAFSQITFLAMIRGTQFERERPPRPQEKTMATAERLLSKRLFSPEENVAEINARIAESANRITLAQYRAMIEAASTLAHKGTFDRPDTEVPVLDAAGNVVAQKPVRLVDEDGKQLQHDHPHCEIETILQHRILTSLNDHIKLTHAGNRWPENFYPDQSGAPSPASAPKPQPVQGKAGARTIDREGKVSEAEAG